MTTDTGGVATTPEGTAAAGEPGLGRRAVAEFTGTAALVTVVVGSGIRAEALSADPGVALLANTLASAIGLGLLVALLGPVSGGHLNPVVTLAAWWSGRRRSGSGPGVAGTGRWVPWYVVAQVAGAVAGALLADVMSGRAPGAWSRQVRSEGHLLVGETVATAGLVLLIAGLRRTGRARWTAPAVAAYLAAAIWFTSSGAFANPAATLGRSLSDSFAGIAPVSLPGFVAAQLLGALLGLALAAAVYGRERAPARRSAGGSAADVRDDRQMVTAGAGQRADGGDGRAPGQDLVDPRDREGRGPAERHAGAVDAET